MMHLKNTDFFFSCVLFKIGKSMLLLEELQEKGEVCFGGRAAECDVNEQVCDAACELT